MRTSVDIFLHLLFLGYPFRGVSLDHSGFPVSKHGRARVGGKCWTRDNEAGPGKQLYQDIPTKARLGKLLGLHVLAFLIYGERDEGHAIELWNEIQIQSQTLLAASTHTPTGTSCQKADSFHGCRLHYHCLTGRFQVLYHLTVWGSF